MRFQVFIENEAGSDRKNYHDERTLTFERAETVSRAYPYPYGFITGTANADGDCLDCFVITSQTLKTGQVVQCEAIGLMEQTEDGLTDNNVLATLMDERTQVTTVVQSTVTEFVQHVFSHIPGRAIEVGRFLGVRAAEVEIDRCRAPVEVREESLTALVEHAKIPIVFTVASVLDGFTGLEGTFDISERPVQPYGPIQDF